MARRTPWELSETVSLSGRRVATRRLRRSTRASSGMSTRKGRMASLAFMGVSLGGGWWLAEKSCDWIACRVIAQQADSFKAIRLEAAGFQHLRQELVKFRANLWDAVHAATRPHLAMSAWGLSRRFGST